MPRKVATAVLLFACLLAWAGGVGVIIAWVRDARTSWMTWNLPSTFSLAIFCRGTPLKLSNTPPISTRPSA